MPLALKLESFFNLPEGKLLKMQAEESVHKYKQKLRGELVGELLKVNAFWLMIALYYFDIRQPEKYLRCVEREHIKQQLGYA